MIYEERIRQLTEMLREAASPTRIILFGSRASGRPDRRSDIDVLVVERGVKDRVAEKSRPHSAGNFFAVQIQSCC
ncbi:MAG: nucleotidyltransferase domain-containing protein [Syntrophorhabdales bacterium]|jgi:predicted nucleotidyltransferase